MKIAALVSGGVDSAVALSLLCDQKADVAAFYIKIWLDDELSFLGNCPWEEDLSYAQAVCDQLGVPLTIISLQREYRDRVISYVLASLRAGFTPNPDVLCNRFIKFGAVWDKIGTDFDAIATGHYAQKAQYGSQVALVQSPDRIKDQTYFLAQMRPDQIEKALFPVGGMLKSETRAYAQSRSLAPVERKDSQGVCFLGKIKFRDFIHHHLGVQPGPFIEYETNKSMGVHDGFWFYTVGQRQGIRLSGGPWYVVAKDVLTNTVFISRSYYQNEQSRRHCVVGNCYWIHGISPTLETLSVKLRHGVGIHSARMVYHEDGRVCCTLEAQDQGIAAGQFAVFYDGDYCIGSGTIMGSLCPQCGVNE